LAAQVKWLRRHRPPQDRIRLRDALAAFTKRVAAQPGIGHEMERDGVASYRVFRIGAGLPYLVWYVYSLADPRAPVRLVMSLHQAQDRERFDARLFD
jgi:plasmid stabilization system protein ParE